MPTFGLRLATDDPARKYLKEVRERLRSPDARQNGWVNGEVLILKEYAVIHAKPLWPPVYILGWLLLVPAIIFGGWSWWLAPGVGVAAFQVLWSRWWWGWMFRRGLRKATGEPRRPAFIESAEKALEQVILSRKTKYCCG